MTRNFVHHLLDAHHALRAAKTAEGGVGHGVRLAAMRDDLHVLQIIAVVTMQHRPVVDRGGQIRRHAAAAREHKIDPDDAAIGIEPNIVVDAEIVPLAGQHHVVVAVQPQLHRPLRPLRQQRGDAGDQRRLRLLAAKAAAHPPRLGHHRMVRQFQGPSDQMLHLRRVLGGGIDQHIAVLPRNRHGDLAFEIEMLLPADIDPPRQPVRRPSQRRGGIAARHELGRQHEGLGGQRLVDGQDRRQRFVFYHRGGGGTTRTGDAVGGNGEDRLAVVLHQPVGEDRIARQGRPDIVHPRHIRRRHHRGHPRHARDRRHVQPGDAGVSVLRQADVGVQQASRFRQVVDIQGLAADMLGRTVVLRVVADRRWRDRVHAGTSSLVRGASAPVSRKTLYSRLRSTLRR